LRYFPIFLDLASREVLIVGGGEKALQKLRLFTKTEARVRIIAEAPALDVEALAEQTGAIVDRRRFSAADVAGAALVLAASDDAVLDLEVATAARSQGIPINVVDGPSESTFIMPAIVDRDPVVVAIGTEGAAPVLARTLKAKIEAWLPARYGHVARQAMALRGLIKSSVGDPIARRRLWERLLLGAWRTAVLNGNHEVAARELEAGIAQARTAQGGSVALIGCGPGDPDLLTLKAQQRLQEADVLVVDRLVDPTVLEYARRDAVRIDAGKTPGGRAMPQDEINRILIREALKGHRVARLKGGDAFIFGRAAEEMAAVRAAGIPVEIVPGITAAHACAASIGLPLTLRRHVRQFAVVTGATAEETLELDWHALAQPGQAFAIYMGVRSAADLHHKLLAVGADPETPVVIVENGTLPGERTVETRLGYLDRVVAGTGIEGPAIIFVGLDWASAGLVRPEHVEFYEPPYAAAAPPVVEAAMPALKVVGGR
jgi:uroporphyrin-III C-methyltransferase/precorrin-2 dehydrogenase/sirohydrochlorin ferrochelatase